MSASALMLLAWVIEIVFGWPDWLYKRIRHPVVWFGSLVSACDAILNSPRAPHSARYIAGIVSTVLLVVSATAMGVGLSATLPESWWGVAIEALIASSLLASRSLFAHVKAVARPLSAGDLSGARAAVSMIVGRDPEQLEQAGIARASLESLAENASDGVIAPLFWGAIFGLPGLVAYKAINTLDSMIGHKTDRYAAYGGFAARLDDVANLVPARLTGFLFALASLKTTALRVMLRDAGRHRSPNAGWPEAAMAGALGIRLSGPRTYGDQVTTEPWLNDSAPDPGPDDLESGLHLYLRAMGLGALTLAIIAIGLAR
ncbi:MAG: adenosylcobinamide-phosphate synthase CbiB [Pseudomonadota bacterium]